MTCPEIHHRQGVSCVKALKHHGTHAGTDGKVTWIWATPFVYDAEIYRLAAIERDRKVHA